jgi:hypothetical protein
MDDDWRVLVNFENVQDNGQLCSWMRSRFISGNTESLFSGRRMSYIIGPVDSGRVQRRENDVNFGRPNEAQGDRFAFRSPQMWTNPRGGDQQSGTVLPVQVRWISSEWSRQARRAPAAFAPRGWLGPAPSHSCGRNPSRVPSREEQLLEAGLPHMRTINC